MRDGTEHTGILTPECPVRVLGRAAGSGARIWFVYEVGWSSEMWLLSPGAHDYLAILDLFAARQDWARRRWPPPKGSLRAFDAKPAAAELMAAAPHVGVTDAGRQYRHGRRGKIAPGCPIVSLGFARIRRRGLVTTSWYDASDRACVYYAAPPADGLYVIRAGGHGRSAIQALFAGTGNGAWLEHLWPWPEGEWHGWDAERAAGDLLSASDRASFVEPPPLPGAEVVPFRRPPPPGGRL